MSDAGVEMRICIAVHLHPAFSVYIVFRIIVQFFRERKVGELLIGYVDTIVNRIDIFRNEYVVYAQFSFVSRIDDECVRSRIF